MLESVLVANRGEIARRIIRTARKLGVRSVAVYSDVDAQLPFVTEADEAICLGEAAVAQSYRNAAAVLEAAAKTNAAAIHPGYGFLSENAEFARQVGEAGLIWVGPPPAAIEALGDKINARNLMAKAGVPVAAGTAEPVSTAEQAQTEAARIGFPLMIKASAGGGGMGMAVAGNAAELSEQFDKIHTFAGRMFGNSSVLLERFFPRVRHVEIQILGLADGRVIALGERDCSVQRRNQKIAEETPSPAVTPQLRQKMEQAAITAGEVVGYRGAGTVECLLDPGSGEFAFLEMNTRLQVEHPITEERYGIDLVAAQLRIAAGVDPGFDPDALEPCGHALELRINAEDSKRFFPGPGAITRWEEPSGKGIRVDAGYAAGTTVTPHYDSLMAKLIVHAENRDTVLERARRAIEEFAIVGPKSNLDFFSELLENSEFVSGNYDTGIVGRMRG